MYEVLNTYRRFDQKNNIILRKFWDPSQHHHVAQRRESILKHIDQEVSGLSLKDFGLVNAGSAVVNSLGTDMNVANSGLTSWQALPFYSVFTLPKHKATLTNAAQTKQLKLVARYFGADLVGITKLDLRWVYSHHYVGETGESKPVEIDPEYKYVVVMAKEMDYHMLATAPSAVSMGETLRVYSQMVGLVSSVAQFIRSLGYRAIPSLNDTALNIPLAMDAGFGQPGRHGLLITPQFGPRQRFCKVITDLPLQPDNHPVVLGVPEFCSVCKKCAKECPGQAISYDDPTAEAVCISNNPGVVKWPVNYEKCYDYFAKVGTNCGVCIRVCPFNKPGSWLHNRTRWIVKHAPWADSMMLWADNRLGYDRYQDSHTFWNGHK